MNAKELSGKIVRGTFHVVAWGAIIGGFILAMKGNSDGPLFFGMGGAYETGHWIGASSPSSRRTKRPTNPTSV